MIRNKLIRTSAVRLALRYTFIYVLLLAAVLAIFLWSTHRYIDDDLESEMYADFEVLAADFSSGGLEALQQRVKERLEKHPNQDLIYVVLGPGGGLRGGNLLSWPDDLPDTTEGEVETLWIDEEVIPRKIYDDDAYWPVLIHEFEGGSRLLLARAVKQNEDILDVTEYVAAVLSVAVLLSLLLGISVGWKILGRMNETSRIAAGIMNGDLSQRVPVSHRNDEFDSLAKRLNLMLDRIQKLIQGLREVTDNTAYDLRSPLTRMRNRLEVTLLEPRSDDEYRDAIHAALEETNSLIMTFNALLEIAQAEAGNHRNQRKPVSIRKLVNDIAELYSPVAEEQAIQFSFEVEGEPEIEGIRDLLAQALGNLLENAFKYTPRGGSVSLPAKPMDGGAEIILTDSGPGIPEEEREHVLERYVRLETSRHTPGNGLGLSMVKAVCGLHNAQLELNDATPGQGLRIWIKLPAAS